MARNIEELINRQIHRWNSLSDILKHRPDTLIEDDAERLAAETERAIHPVICISREMGAGAREIARLLCRRLNYDLFGREIINQIARDLKVQERLVRSLEEQDRAGLHLLVESFLCGHEIELSDFLNSLVRVVQTLALKGGVVILGRGANYILGDKSALNVRVVAPLTDRIERVRHYLNIDADRARNLIERSDYVRNRFIHKFFHIEMAELERFDIVINTSRIPAVAATELILSALRVRGFIPERMAIPAKVDM